MITSQGGLGTGPIVARLGVPLAVLAAVAIDGPIGLAGYRALPSRANA